MKKATKKIKIHYVADKLSAMQWASNYNRKGFSITIDRTDNGWFQVRIDANLKR